ncbi:AMINO ACID-LIGASE [Salix viminalis]|uniref:AMINO ACID-LIGASE n=1 Tax=Salix viminalis TaxID=40686 RepID=A0A9Q0UF96_SALVM|nr:AMINO ACID-LIGASE [Salix viminalis]
MSSSGSSNKPRTVRLRCPSVSSTVSFFAWDDQRLDLGSIARTFGLDPSTLKLNGYFISRGIDLVSSSVTWRSLLSFFTARGLSTGKDDREALIVDGNLSKVGTKRAHDPQSASSRSNYRAEVEGIGVSISGQQHQDINFLMNKRMKESNSGCDKSYQMPKWSGPGLKRKQSIEHHVNLLKRLRINGANSGTCPDFRGDILSVSSCTLDL